ncbi:hypothetical protein [Actinoplanes sp. NPDC026619]|uniref:hypothetical protein n=1 Tax=Actinoplanes sp. NPDC026619 TaxID=3155798 RepID=UPI0033C55668
MVDFLLGGAAVVLLVVVTVVLFRGEHPGRSRLVTLVALIVLAAGTFAVAIYHHQSSSAEATDLRLPLPLASAAPALSPATQGLGTAILQIEIPMGTGDKLPQGAIWLDPPRPGTNAYTGDLSLLCSTPGKADHDQNCTGADKRVWTVEPLEKRAVIAPAAGDPFTDRVACDVSYSPAYLELKAGAAYCVRLTAGPSRTWVLRVPSFPAERPLPASLKTEVAALG